LVEIIGKIYLIGVPFKKKGLAVSVVEDACMVLDLLACASSNPIVVFAFVYMLPYASKGVQFSKQKPRNTTWQ
jgi:hypothetical protein